MNRRRSTDFGRGRRSGALRLTAGRPATGALTPAKAARSAGLHYGSDTVPGLRRFVRRRAVQYVDARNRPVRNPRDLARIKALAIPPAWTEVWISPDPESHLQATGRDARGRKQYRYHRQWREVRDETKYHRLIAFARALPRLRQRVQRDLRRPGLGREKVLATVVRLLELSSIRVGNEEYAHQNGSYGLTTLQDRHARVKGARVQLHFRGKSGRDHEIKIQHPVIARIVKRCQNLPGQDLFQYVGDDGLPHDVTSGDVNDYLAHVTGSDFTAKDFRTWTGTILAAVALAEFNRIDSQAQGRRQVVRAIEQVAKRLGNTPTVCKKCYVHPAIFEAYMDGTLATALKGRTEQDLRRSLGRLSPEEAAVVALLRRRASQSEDGRLRSQLSRSLKATRPSRSSKRI